MKKRQSRFFCFVFLAAFSFSFSSLFKALIACSSFSLGDKIIELMAQSPDVLPVVLEKLSLAWKKDEAKEVKEEKAIMSDVIIKIALLGSFLNGRLSCVCLMISSQWTTNH